MTKATIPNLLENPKFRQFIETFGRLAKESEKMPLDEARKKCTEFFLSQNAVFEPVHRIENVTIEGFDKTKIPLRIYIPKEAQGLPTIVYFHRGGWVFANIEEADPTCRRLANHLGCIVVSVEYRLAPENPFPKPLHDCYDATKWAAMNIKKYGGDPSQLIVFGESAGGNLAGAVSLLARDQKVPAIAAQVLIYPVATAVVKDAPYDRAADHYFVTKDSMRFFLAAYLQSPADLKNPYASIDLADHKNLPPALVITAEYDPLKEEGQRYAESLRKEGVRVIAKTFPEVIHGFIDLPIYDEKQKIGWVNEIGKLLKELGISL